MAGRHRKRAHNAWAWVLPTLDAVARLAALAAAVITLYK